MKPDALSQQFNTTEEEEDPGLILAPSYLVGAIFWETKNAIYAFPIFSMCPKSSLYAPARCALFPSLCFGCARPPPLFHHSAWVELIASFPFWPTHLLLSTHW